MPAFCCVIKCYSDARKDDLKFFRIPKNLNLQHRTDLNQLSFLRKQKWLDAINREDLTEHKLKNARICAKHFLTGKPANLEDNLNPDWVPSLHMGHSATVKRRRSRFKRVKKKVELQDDDEETVSWSDEEMEINEEEFRHDKVLIKKRLCQTDTDAADLCLLFVKLSKYEDTIRTLKGRVMCVENLKNDDHKTKYYTGLPSYKLFNRIVKRIKSYVTIEGNMSLAAEEQILLTLIKLRLNLDFTDIGYRFSVHPITAFLYFKNVIHIMAQRFESLIIWPERSTPQKTMPHCFQEFFHDKTTVIIDCFNIKYKRQSKLRTAAEAWSNYKNLETVKYLVGITPQGSICFISEGWGGPASDKVLTHNTSFLNYLSPGDIVMADRGFLIKEFLQTFNDTVKIPAFTRGERQLDATDLEETKGVAQVRTHVDRIIDFIRQRFKILDGTLPIELFFTQGDEDKILLDEIVLVSCALINLSPPRWAAAPLS